MASNVEEKVGVNADCVFSTASRREFIRFGLAGLASPILLGCGSHLNAQRRDDDLRSKLLNNAIKDAGVTWCGARDLPERVTSKALLATAADKGERFIIDGTVYAADGKTAAPNTLIYLYHTDIYGIYGRDGEHQHGRYRTWLLTDEKGRYSFETIRPASYPNTTIAAHIHMTVTTAEKKEDWIDSILFEEDKFISRSERHNAGKKGGFQPIVTLEKRSDGKFYGSRNIQLA